MTGPGEDGAAGTVGRQGRRQFVLVTGMSGAGRSTSLKVLEDLGYEAVDNLPLSLLPGLMAGWRDAAEARPIAVGVDVRSRDFAVTAVEAAFEGIVQTDHLSGRILFLDCDDSVLIRRYAETRRRHPLAADRPVEAGLALERRIIAPLRDLADAVIDTTELAVWDLKQRLTREFSFEGAHPMAISVTSFSYRAGLPRESDLVFDVRFLANPHYDPALRPLTGLDPGVGERIRNDAAFEPFWGRLTDLLALTLPRYEREGKSYLSIGFGCTGGRHRSVFLAERMAEWLRGGGWSVHVSHRDLTPEPGSAEIGAKAGTGGQEIGGIGRGTTGMSS